MRSATKNDALLDRWAETLSSQGAEAAVMSPDGVRERTFAEIENEARELEEGLLAPWAAGHRPRHPDRQ